MARILVAGSINFDRVLRVPALVPGGRIRAVDLGSFIGGAGSNTGRALAQAGHHVTLASALGRGAAGDGLLARLHDAGLDVTRVTRPDRPVAEPLIFVEDNGERTILATGPEVPAPQDEEVDYARFGDDWDAIYAARRDVGLRALCQRALGRSLVLAQWYAGMPAPAADVIIGSLEAFGGVMPELPAPDALDLPRWLVITDGARGAVALGRAGARIHRPAAPAATLRDTTGAGDVYAAGLLHGLLAGWPIARAMDLGAALAAVQIGVDGPTPPESLAAVFSAART